MPPFVAAGLSARVTAISRTSNAVTVWRKLIDSPLFRTALSVRNLPGLVGSIRKRYRRWFVHPYEKCSRKRLLRKTLPARGMRCQTSASTKSVMNRTTSRSGLLPGPLRSRPVRRLTCLLPVSPPLGAEHRSPTSGLVGRGGGPARPCGRRGQLGVLAGGEAVQIGVHADG